MTTIPEQVPEHITRMKVQNAVMAFLMDAATGGGLPLGHHGVPIEPAETVTAMDELHAIIKLLKGRMLGVEPVSTEQAACAARGHRNKDGIALTQNTFPPGCGYCDMKFDGGEP